MRVLIIKLSSLGDLLHALPTAHNLKQALDASIDWAVNREYAPLVTTFTDISHVISVDRRAFLKNIGRLRADIRAEEYDTIIDLQGLFKSAIVARMANGERRLGPSFYREFTNLFYSDVVGPRNRNRHAVDECLDVIRFLNLDRTAVTFNVDFPRIALGGTGRSVAIAPISRRREKNWPLSSFIQLAQALQHQEQTTIYLLGAASDRAACDQIANELSGPVENLAGQTSLVELGGTLAAMDLLIANDSGILHLATAAGTPALGIYITTNPLRTGPYGERGRTIGNGNGDLPPPESGIRAAKAMLDRSAD
jgi:lipopolysaccharide heptosyltransferase I